MRFVLKDLGLVRTVWDFFKGQKRREPGGLQHHGRVNHHSDAPTPHPGVLRLREVQRFAQEH